MSFDMTKENSVNKKLLVVKICALVVSVFCLLTGVLFGIFISPPVWYEIYSDKLDVPEPEITYAEFPLEIEYVYVVTGETHVIQDVLVCEYDGFRKSGFMENFELGRYYNRYWSGKTNSNATKFVLLENDKIRIEFQLGSPDYYMGDTDTWTTYPAFQVFRRKKDGWLTGEVIHTEELAEYGIYIIECELPQPIENSFDVRDNNR